MSNPRKPVSPVLSAAIIAVGVIVLMWISGHSSMVIRQSQIDLIRSEQTAKENLVIVHVSNSGTDIIIFTYVINTGYSKVFLGPIRIPELRTLMLPSEGLKACTLSPYIMFIALDRMRTLSSYYNLGFR